MLWVASFLSIIVYILQPVGNLSSLYFFFILIFIIILTGIITFAQNNIPGESTEGFCKNMLPSVAKVLRDGKLTQISAEKLVRGDIIEIISGDKVPADIRIIQSIDMKVDNSVITGEKEPPLRCPECTHPY